jgi:K+:H+ antiporter
MPVITMILVILIALAVVTNFIGVHTVLGAFVAGIMIGQSPILTKTLRAIARTDRGLVHADLLWGGAARH